MTNHGIFQIPRDRNVYLPKRNPNPSPCPHSMVVATTQAVVAVTYGRAVPHCTSAALASDSPGRGATPCVLVVGGPATLVGDYPYRGPLASANRPRKGLAVADHPCRGPGHGRPTLQVASWPHLRCVSCEKCSKNQ
ncbi:hypothetical protein B296_00015049 [Ensete ventricosum]|uniref:Uncharacterized protein n=1 Tax=Ensete ventricosum TaxID=4639 RepID=A0A426XZX6_ENSVE|nr:hypothetical protein B296_00015049 [Ensete ventricosum]